MHSGFTKCTPQKFKKNQQTHENMTQQQRLIYDSSLNSTALRLYVAVVGFQVEQQEGKNDEVYPQLIINSETTLLGATTIAQYIDRQVSASVVTRATTLESCQVCCE